MPRLKEPCPLCLPACSKKEQDLLWYGMAEAGRPGALAVAKELGVPGADEKMIRRHFEYHFPRQASPKEIWKTDYALEQASALVKRKRSILDITFRLGAIDSPFAGLALYWKGEEDKLFSAEKNAARDLRSLLDDNYLFRVYPDNLPGKNVWLQNEIVSVPLPVFFLGINARAWVQKSSGYNLDTKKDTLTTPEDAESWARILGIIGPTKFIGALMKQLPDLEPPMGRSGNINGVEVIVDCQNFFNYRFINLRLDDPLKRAFVLRSSGIGALTLFDKEFKPFLTPFIYNYDDGRRQPEKIISDVISQQTLARAEKIQEISPQIHPASFIPSLVIAKDKERLVKIKAEAKKKRSEVSAESSALIISSEDLDNCLKERSWQSLFYTGEKEALIPALIKNYQRHPIRAEKLDLIGSRKSQESN